MDSDLNSLPPLALGSSIAQPLAQWPTLKLVPFVRPTDASNGA